MPSPRFKPGNKYRFAKGKSANPGGKPGPRKLTFSDRYAEMTEEPCPEEIRKSYNTLLKCHKCDGAAVIKKTIKTTGIIRTRACHACKKTGWKQLLPKGATWADAIAMGQLLEAGTRRNNTSVRELRESIEGTAKQRVEVSTAEDRDIKIRVVYDEPAAPKK